MGLFKKTAQPRPKVNRKLQICRNLLILIALLQENQKAINFNML